MTRSRQALAVLLLASGFLEAPSAEAAIIIGTRTKKEVSGKSYFSYIVDGDEANEVASVELQLSSDGGTENLLLTESDAWLHGSASLPTLPKKDAPITLTLYDQDSIALMTFSGTFTTAGTVSFQEGVPTCLSVSRIGCTGESAYDLRLLAEQLETQGSGLLSFDLAGADTYGVAYATVEVSGSGKTEVDWESIGSVWTAGSTINHTGVIEAKAKARDSDGSTLENLKTFLGEPWLDDGEGVSVLAAGTSTSVAFTHIGSDLFSGGHVRTPRMTVMSEGWGTTSYPTHAQLELAGSTSLTVPAHSYQRKGDLFKIGDEIEVTILSIDRSQRLTLSSGAFLLQNRDPSELTSPFCSSGTCVLAIEDEKGYHLAITSYSSDPAKLATKQSFGLVLYDKSGAKVSSKTLAVTYETSITAVFAGELQLEGDPFGDDASGSIRLLGAADKKGKQATLSKESFYAQVTCDGDGDLALGGYGVDDGATSNASEALQLGEPVLCESERCDGISSVLAFSDGGKVKKIVVSAGGLSYNAF